MLRKNTGKFLQDESGATAIEYGLIAALVSVAAMLAWVMIVSSVCRSAYQAHHRRRVSQYYADNVANCINLSQRRRLAARGLSAAQPSRPPGQRAASVAAISINSSRSIRVST